MNLMIQWMKKKMTTVGKSLKFFIYHCAHVSIFMKDRWDRRKEYD